MDGLSSRNYYVYQTRMVKARPFTPELGFSYESCLWGKTRAFHGNFAKAHSQIGDWTGPWPVSTAPPTGPRFLCRWRAHGWDVFRFIGTHFSRVRLTEFGTMSGCWGGREREKLPLTKGVRYTLLNANTSHYISILAVCPVTLH